MIIFLKTILFNFYNNCLRTDFTLFVDELLLDLLNPLSSKTIEIRYWKHVFSKITFHENALVLHQFGIHCFISLDPFWHYLLICFGIGLLHRTIFEPKMVPEIDPLGNIFLLKN